MRKKDSELTESLGERRGASPASAEQFLPTPDSACCPFLFTSPPSVTEKQCNAARSPPYLTSARHPSTEKLEWINALCARLGVRTRPACVGGVWIFPLLSWYHASWDREPDVPGAEPISKVRRQQ